MDRQRLSARLIEDRNALVRILVTNGYSVRIVTDKVEGKKETFVEYWKEEK